MHLFNRADVVYAYYSWKHMNGEVDGDYRPVVIKDLLPKNRYKILKISSSNKNEDLLRVVVNSPEWKQMGLHDLSFNSLIDKNAILEIERMKLMKN